MYIAGGIRPGFCDNLNAVMMCRIVEGCPLLEVLNLEGCQLIDHDCIKYALFNAFRNHQSIVHQLPSNSLVLRNANLTIKPPSHRNKTTTWISLQLKTDVCGDKWCYFFLLRILQLILDCYANSPNYVMSTCHTALTYKMRVCQHLPRGYPS